MSQKKSVLIAGLFGNALEWYDFILYANFAPLIAQLFFPANNPLTSLLLTFAVFAIGFVVRPLGAVFFGYIGDHFGRRKALILSIGLITIPTFSIGLLPSFAIIGVAAPILLTFLRILQGIAISGELNTATTFLVEHAKPNRRGFTGSLVMGTAFLGILAGALVSFALTFTLSSEQLYQWGWRSGFWLSGILGLVGFAMRLRTHESPLFLQKAPTESHAPLKHVFLFFRRELCLTVLLTTIMAVGNYIFIAYIMTYLVKSQGFSLQKASIINLIAMLFTVPLFPLMGLLSDKIGRKPVFKLGLWGFIFLSIPIFWLLSQKQFVYVLMGDLLLSAILVPIAALIPILLAELFPTHVRNSGTTIGYNLCLAIFGGTAPLASLAFVNWSGSDYAPAWYLMGCASLSAIALYFMEEKHQQPLA